MWFSSDHSSSFQSTPKPTCVHNILQQASVFPRSRPWRCIMVSSASSGTPSICTSHQRIHLQLLSWNVIAFELQIISPSLFPSLPCFASVQISFPDSHQTFPTSDGNGSFDAQTRSSVRTVLQWLMEVFWYRIFRGPSAYSRSRNPASLPSRQLGVCIYQSSTCHIFRPLSQGQI